MQLKELVMDKSKVRFVTCAPLDSPDVSVKLGSTSLNCLLLQAPDKLIELLLSHHQWPLFDFMFATVILALRHVQGDPAAEESDQSDYDSEDTSSKNEVEAREKGIPLDKWFKHPIECINNATNDNV